MNSDATLERTLAALREEESRVETPARVETAVMAAWDSDHSNVGAASAAVWKHAVAVAAGVMLAVALGRLGHELRDAPRLPADESTGTLLLVGEPILDGEPVRVVRMRMPAATLVNLGIRSTAGDLADVLDVDVIVGEDGVARAIRF